MAALYLHNAIFIPEESDSTRGHSPHTRTISTGTLRTIATSHTSHSYPTEPLLQDSSTVASSAYHDMLSRQPAHPAGPRTGWDMGLSLDGHPMTSRERRRFWEQTVRRRLKLLKTFKVSLELIMGKFLPQQQVYQILYATGAWAVFNAIRYFIAYTIYISIDGQTVALVMGTATTLSFAFLICAAVLALLQVRLMVHHIPIRAILITGTVLRSLASFCLIAPAIVNLILTIVWRNSLGSEFGLGQRCQLDIDVIWSVSNKSCSPPTWGLWLGLAIARVVVTSMVIVSYTTI